MVTGDRGKLRGLNQVGMKRSGMSEADIKAATRAYMFIFKGKEGTLEERVGQAKEKFKGNAIVQEQIKFIEFGLKDRRNILTAE